MPLATIFPTARASPWPPGRKIPGPWAARPVATPQSTRSKISLAIANKPANTRAASQSQRGSRTPKQPDELRVAVLPYLWGVAQSGRERAQNGARHGRGVAPPGNAKPYFASVATADSLFRNSRNARAASLFLALLNTMAPCAIGRCADR